MNESKIVSGVLEAAVYIGQAVIFFILLALSKEYRVAGPIDASSFQHLMIGTPIRAVKGE